MSLNPIAVAALVQRALEEDLGPGDITSEACIPADLAATGTIVTREAGVVCGQPVAAAAFCALDPAVTYTHLVQEGESVQAGCPVATVRGPARAILGAERVALNFLQRMSGIATLTREMAESIKYYAARIVDTRKTTPSLRMIEKYAVRVGGGFNHRMGLYDGIVIKDSHITLAGGIRPAVAAARRHASHAVRVEVEVKSLEQLEEALAVGPDIILLDSMGIEEIRRAVEIAAGRVLLEASGGITGENLADVAKTGVNFISIGALTQSAPPLALSLEVSAGAPYA